MFSLNANLEPGIARALTLLVFDPTDVREFVAVTRCGLDEVLRLQLPEIDAIDTECHIRSADRFDCDDSLPRAFGDEQGRSCFDHLHEQVQLWLGQGNHELRLPAWSPERFCRVRHQLCGVSGVPSSTS